ncbi:DUF927 domain-containing protein [Acinetobacter sp. HY1485]|uniref:DUF927 domain-containing protein n=1 Tax=Acinetobacter sp. HY1485 TaxID=2970918 RepID=UPI0022B945AF|nr:DUF927 domain-containing protein [Acinetobacter sp. HY1485]
MNDQEAPITEIEHPEQIIAQCVQIDPSKHALTLQYGNPQKPLYGDTNVELNGINYDCPVVLPLVDGQLQVVQCAVLQHAKPVAIVPYGIARGFAYLGELKKDKPIIITHNLEVFFKVASSGVPVVLVPLPHLCRNAVLKPFDFEQIHAVINQLSDAGYNKLYMPVRPENIELEAYQQLEQKTAVRLLNQHTQVGESEFLTELNKEDDAEEVYAFIHEAIDLLPEIDLLPKGHLAKPMRWENGVFHILKDGIFFIETDKNENEYKRYISSPILVLAKTRDNTSNNWGVLLEWHDDGGVKHTQALSRELFQTDGADLRKALAYQGVNIAPNRRARDLLQCYLIAYKAENIASCVERVGWHDDVFILPHKQIGQSNELIVYQANHGLDNRYQTQSTLQLWQDQVSKTIAGHSKLVFALCTAFAGQLLAPLNLKGGGFHIRGGSSKGKSTALYVACSVWGKPSQFYRTWRATGNALEHTAYMHNDSFIVLDEIGEIPNPKELGNIIYMLANGESKARLTRNITAKPTHKWQLIFLSSGEKSLKEIMQEQGQKTKLGQEVRLADIDIDASPYGVFDGLDFADSGAKQSMEIVNRANTHYGTAGEAWLEYLTHHKAEQTEQAQDLLQQYSEALAHDQPQGHIKRVAHHFALVAVAGELATQADITGWQCGTAFKAVQQVFNEWLGGFDHVGNFEEREILNHVKAFFEAHGASRFECITPDPDRPERIINRVGYWKIEGNEKKYLVFPEQFKKEICQGFNPKQVAKVLKAYGWLDHLNNDKATKLIRGIDGQAKAIPMYVFNEQVFTHIG